MRHDPGTLDVLPNYVRIPATVARPRSRQCGTSAGLSRRGAGDSPPVLFCSCTWEEENRQRSSRLLDYVSDDLYLAWPIVSP